MDFIGYQGKWHCQAALIKRRVDSSPKYENPFTITPHNTNSDILCDTLHSHSQSKH